MYKEGLVKYYDVLYSTKDYKGEVEYIKEAVDSLKDARILDVGCGTGTHAALLAKHTSLLVLGVDTSKEMIDVAQRKSLTQPNLEFKHVSVAKLKESNFNVVVSLFNVVNHIQTLTELIDFFEEIKARMHPSGYFIFDCWNGVATISDLPRKDRRRAHCDGIGTLVTAYDPVPDLMNSQIIMKNTVQVLGANKSVEKFEYELVHRIWTPTLLNEILSLVGFRVTNIHKAFVHNRIALEDDYKIVFTSRINDI
tara:strand:+ start:554 stop:1309 length:756 start_codon:yes stop_codon:yes gene_type:complete